MAVDEHSYGSIDEVAALTRVYLGGESTYNSTTRPTLDEVEAMVDRASGVLNVALANAGFGIPVAQADAKKACAEWVVGKVATLIELAQPAQPRDGRPNRRASAFNALHAEAADWVAEYAVGFANLGVSRTQPEGQAISFTGETAQSDRPDGSNSGLEQPKFTRGQFDS
jgi:hypothetical protein